MKTFLLSLLDAWRLAWRGWLRLLALPWHWLAALLGLSRPSRPAKTSTTTAKAATDMTPPHAAKAAPRSGERAPLAEHEHPRDPDAAPSARPTARAAAGAAPSAKGEVATPARPAAPSTPGEQPTAPGQFTEGMFSNEAGQRDYKLYIPANPAEGPRNGKANAKDGGKRPLVVMLHGCKQDPDDFAAGTRMNPLADSQQVLVLYPAQARAANGFGCWNWFNRGDQERGAGEPAILAGMIQDVVAKHAVDPQRVYVAGLSAGGAMALILARTYPEMLAAAGVHSGLAYGVAQDMITAMGVMKRGPGKRALAAPAKGGKKGAKLAASVPLIVFHGDNDDTVHPLNGEQVIEQALAASPVVQGGEGGQGAGIVLEQGKVAGGRAYTRTLHSNGTAAAHAEHWLVHGAGHAWAGGDAHGSFTDPQGPDASSEMLRFFLERPRA